MTRKHFAKLAQIVSCIKDPTERKEVARLLVDMCREENPRFDSNKFYEACGVEK